MSDLRKFALALHEIGYLGLIPSDPAERTLTPPPRTNAGARTLIGYRSS